MYAMWGLLQGMWSNFLPSWFLLRPSAIIITILISTHSPHLLLQLLQHTLRRERTTSVAYLYGMSLLLSFVFDPGLRLSTVTTQPSSYPCIDIATDVISVCCKEKEGWEQFWKWA